MLNGNAPFFKPLLTHFPHRKWVDTTIPSGWECSVFANFSSRIATKNKDSKCSLVLTIAAQYGLVNQESFFNKSVASENLTGYYLLHKGEFAYNRSYSAGYDWGAVKRLDNYDEGVLSTLYICFKINKTIVDSDYLAYYFESTKWHRGLSDIAGEGARNHGLLNVSITDYFNTKHRFPVIEEQKAIAKMLNTITEKERKATLLGECYQKQKQYLLRQMFIWTFGEADTAFLNGIILIFVLHY